MDKHKKKRKRHSENYQNTDSVLTRNGPSRTKKRPKTIIFPTDCWRIQSKSISQTSKKILFSRGTVSDLKIWEFLIRTYRIKEYLIHNLKWLWVRGLWTRWPLTIKERQNDKDKTKRNEQEWRQCVTTGLQSASYSCAAVQWEDLNWHIDSFKWTWISYFCHVDVETICVESMFRRCWRHDVVFARSEILPTVISWVR